MHTKVLESYSTPLNAFVKRIHLLVVDNAFPRAADYLTKKKLTSRMRSPVTLWSRMPKRLSKQYGLLLLSLVSPPPPATHTQVEGKFFLLKTHVLWK